MSRSRPAAAAHATACPARALHGATSHSHFHSEARRLSAVALRGTLRLHMSESKAPPAPRPPQKTTKDDPSAEGIQHVAAEHLCDHGAFPKENHSPSQKYQTSLWGVPLESLPAITKALELGSATAAMPRRAPHGALLDFDLASSKLLKEPIQIVSSSFLPEAPPSTSKTSSSKRTAAPQDRGAQEAACLSIFHVPLAALRCQTSFRARHPGPSPPRR
mmetsp:Transcript_74019/g.176188  ORF Transcript_74019/g.176188 Transcript_74019/m.176188 type:complete len:218 (+) Transcript_74019:86-739(+)